MLASRLNFYEDVSFSKTVVRYHVLSSETGLAVRRLLRLVDVSGDIIVVVPWEGIKNNETVEPLDQV